MMISSGRSSRSSHDSPAGNAPPLQAVVPVRPVRRPRAGSRRRSERGRWLVERRPPTGTRSARSGVLGLRDVPKASDGPSAEPRCTDRTRRDLAPCRERAHRGRPGPHQRRRDGPHRPARAGQARDGAPGGFLPPDGGSNSSGGLPAEVQAWEVLMGGTAPEPDPEQCELRIPRRSRRGDGNDRRRLSRAQPSSGPA
jgi:hypothetical protein